MVHNQNHKSYVDYVRGRAKAFKRQQLDQFYTYADSAREDMVKTLQPLFKTKKASNPELNDKPFHIHWQKMEGLAEPPIDPSINEYYLFHGTNPESAMGISEDDFSINLAGANAGSLYGRGVYFAECCIKADEYASTAKDSALNPMLCCRVVLGKVGWLKIKCVGDE